MGKRSIQSPNDVLGEMPSEVLAYSKAINVMTVEQLAKLPTRLRAKTWQQRRSLPTHSHCNRVHSTW